MIALLNPRLWIALALAGVLAFSHLIAYRSGRAAVQAKWTAANVATERAAQEQATRIRDLQRAAELRYIVQREAQDRFHVVTVKEVHEAAAPLASCPVPDAVRVRLNSAARCARGDSAAAGCTAPEVPDAR